MADNLLQSFILMIKFHQMIHHSLLLLLSWWLLILSLNSLLNYPFQNFLSISRSPQYFLNKELFILSLCSSLNKQLQYLINLNLTTTMTYLNQINVWRIYLTVQIIIPISFNWFEEYFEIIEFMGKSLWVVFSLACQFEFYNQGK